MNTPAIEDIEKQRHEYVVKTYFFSVFNKVLADKGFKVHVERKTVQANGHPCYPDFYCTAGREQSRTIFEHKGSVSSDKKHILKEIVDTERYLDLEEQSNVEDVVLLVPRESGELVSSVAEEKGTELVIWSFSFDIHKRLLAFSEEHNEIKSDDYAWLTEKAIGFPLAWCSFRRFLRDEPPVVYTAEFLWNIVLRSLYDHGLSFEGPFELDLGDVVEVAKRFYPGGEDSAQITSERIRKALRFLNDIEWVTFPNDKGGVTVHKKRIREDLVSRVLCEEYVETQVGIQTTLEEYQDTSSEEESDS